MDIEEYGLIPDLGCVELGCNKKCNLLNPSQCPVLARANKMEMEASKAILLQEAEDLVK